MFVQHDPPLSTNGGPVEMADVWLRQALHEGHVFISEDQHTTVALLQAAVA